MASTCLNCDTALTDKYCPHCGQKSTVDRISWHHVVEEVLHFFTHLEHGFLATTRLLITQPGLLNKNYLDGKRKSYHKPISFLLIWIAIYLLIYNIVNKFTHHPDLNTESFFSNNAAVTAVFTKYRSLVELMIVPVSSFTGWIILARPRLNYFEILSTGFFGTSILFITLSIQFIAAFIFNINFHTNIFDSITAVIYAGWSFYAGYDLFKRYNVSWLVPRLFLAMVIGGLSYSILSREISKLFMAWGF
jgi:Protein of unknown function (DUF3667)